jgi:hypothetical protein
MFLFEPPHLYSFFIMTGIMHGEPFATTLHHTHRTFWPTYVVDIGLWFPIQILNFRRVPLVYQPVVINVTCIGWNAYLSYTKHSKVEEDQNAAKVNVNG